MRNSLNHKPKGTPYRLRITSPEGVTSWHRHEGAQGVSVTFRGPGLASAVRTLQKRGFTVEKIAC